jgi:hypothetical protein
MTTPLTLEMVKNTFPGATVVAISHEYEVTPRKGVTFEVTLIECLVGFKKDSTQSTGIVAFALKNDEVVTLFEIDYETNVLKPRDLRNMRSAKPIAKYPSSMDGITSMTHYYMAGLETCYLHRPNELIEGFAQAL